MCTLVHIHVAPFNADLLADCEQNICAMERTLDICGVYLGHDLLLQEYGFRCVQMGVCGSADGAHGDQSDRFGCQNMSFYPEMLQKKKK